MENQPDIEPVSENTENADSGGLRAPFDAFSKIRALLPRVRSLLLKQKTSGPSILSAERAPAAEVLKATQVPEVPRAPSIPAHLPDIPQTVANALPDVPALHTYKGDVAQSISQHNISLAAIAQAQAKKQEPLSQGSSWFPNHWVALVLGGIAALFIAAGLILLIVSYARFTPVPGATPVASSIIYADKTEAVSVVPGESRSTLMQALVLAEGESIPLGLVEQLAISMASTAPSATAPMNTESFLSILAPHAPDQLARSLAPQFLLGLHSNGGNSPFLIFKTDSYTEVYAGVLAWEGEMQADLSPLFPIPIIATNAPIATTSGTTTPTAARTSTTSTLSTGATQTSQILETPFTDAIVDNEDARVLRDQAGNISLLWSFVDRQTLVITTNAATLSEVVSRLQKAPTITFPGK